MLKYLLFSLISFTFFFPAFAQTAQTKVRVKNTAEFIKAIKSNTIIEMEYGLYQFENELNDYPQAGKGFVIEGVTNLTIIGVGKFPSELILEDEYSTVLIFYKCISVKIENLEIGHGAAKGYCSGSVVKTVETTDLSINKCILYGSGAYGIESLDSQTILCQNSTIRSCTYGAITMYNTHKVTFKNCSFTDNGRYDIFTFENCNNITFDTCVIKDNINSDPEEKTHQASSNLLFAVIGTSTPINLTNCLVKFNRVDYLVNKKTAIKNINSVIEHNLSYKGYNKE
jgi:hypothetical protein